MVYLQTKQKRCFKRLLPGSIIEIIAPSAKEKTSEYNLENELQKVREFIEKLGFVAKINSKIYGDDVFYANDNFTRAKLLKDALISESVDALWAIRGGKGATELIPYLTGKIKNFDGLPEILTKEKLLIGFSDITALHILLNDKYNWQTLHAPVVNQVVKSGRIDEQSKLLLYNFLMTNNKSDCIHYELEELTDSREDQRIIRGKIIGGNLSIIEESLGTDWEPITKNKIFFIEETGGAAYQLERSLTHLIQSGKLDEVQAIIFGQFTNIKGEELIKQIEERFIQKFSEYKNLNNNTPIFKTNDIGHENTNYPLPLDTEVVISSFGSDSHMLHMDMCY